VEVGQDVDVNGWKGGWCRLMYYILDDIKDAMNEPLLLLLLELEMMLRCEYASYWFHLDVMVLVQ
jgi:hypothetical protein